ncbi:MAG: carboxypeptidase regulatory-like domain-containing protein [Candidatus Omnitrophica bacterium]|nr:carboxypeptidase regulatory-like domain-containing protein [Candidatus Omnitrophota bacterium]
MALVYKNISRLLLIVLLLLGLQGAASSQVVPPPRYGELNGRVINQWHHPVYGITVTLKPTAYGYGTHDFTAVSNMNGHYDIKNIDRYVYSSGPAPKWVSYYISVSAPGYLPYTSSTFNFEAVADIKMNVTLTAQKEHGKKDK